MDTRTCGFERRSRLNRACVLHGQNHLGNCQQDADCGEFNDSGDVEMSLRKRILNWFNAHPSIEITSTELTKILKDEASNVRSTISFLAREGKIKISGRVGRLLLYTKAPEYSAEIFPKIRTKPIGSKLPAGIKGIIVHLC